MAVVYTLVNASLNQIRFKVTSAGAENADLTNATMVAACFNGSPLEALLSTTVASQSAARALAFDHPNLQIEFPGVIRDVDAKWIVDADDDGASDKLKLNCAAAAADALGSYLTITYRHSMTR